MGEGLSLGNGFGATKANMKRVIIAQNVLRSCGFKLKHGFLERAGIILEEVVRTPNRAPTRIMASCGVHYGFLRRLLEAGLVEAVGESHYDRRLRLTEKGREFMKHYRAILSLIPSELRENREP